MRLSDFDYVLPPDRIAQYPSPRRDGSRLMVVRPEKDEREHLRFFQIEYLLQPRDVLVLNDARVIPGRLHGIKDTGGQVEVLLLEPVEPSGAPWVETSLTWRCLMRPSARMRIGHRICFSEGLQCTVIARDHEGQWVIQFCTSKRSIWKALLKVGKTPLPPYIRVNGDEERERQDRLRYQTVYAKNFGAAAAPTAGLHFTRGLLNRIAQRGVHVRFLTLHVGAGTFLPIRGEEVDGYRMHSELYNIPAETAEAINTARSEGNRIVAVGTTTVRALEHAALSDEVLPAKTARADLFIRPGHRFRIVDAMVTNFHLPRSTLLMLVSAFAGREVILDAYQEAIRLGYRFYSYGDAMFLEKPRPEINSTSES